MDFLLSNIDRNSASTFGLRLGIDTARSHDQKTSRLEEQVAQLYEELRLPLFRYLLCMRVLPEEAEEIVQESFLKLFKHLHAGGREDNLRGWIYRVAHNLSGTRRKARRFLVDTSTDAWEQICFSTAASEAGPEEVLLTKEKMTRLHQDIAGLSELQQNCIRLRVEGFRYREIARILNVSTSTVAGSLRHAIERLTRES